MLAGGLLIQGITPPLNRHGFRTLRVFPFGLLNQFIVVIQESLRPHVQQQVCSQFNLLPDFRNYIYKISVVDIPDRSQGYRIRLPLCRTNDIQHVYCRISRSNQLTAFLLQPLSATFLWGGLFQVIQSIEERREREYDFIHAILIHLMQDSLRLADPDITLL